jgi:hypothetical protein
MHIFHKWVEVAKQKGTATVTYIFTKSEEPVIAVLERCSVCSKERAYIKTMSGIKQWVDPEFIKT